MDGNRVTGRARGSGPAAVLGACEPASAATATVEACLRPLVAGRALPGLAFAVVTPAGQGTGQVTRAGGQALGPHVVLEIGSVTKVFTALLLADMAHRGEAGLDDPVAGYLPAAVARDCPGTARITLRHLATHTSGLPRLPPGLLLMALGHRDDPYARYGADRLYRALRVVGRTPPGGYLYSNFGAGLLGHLLGLAAGRPYAGLVAERVTGPLELAETGTVPSAGCVAAQGYRGRRPVPRWDMSALAGAGALNSTAADLARFLHASLHPQATPIAEAAEEAQRPQPQAPGGPRTGLGWHITERQGRLVHWHNGGTGGFSAMLALDRQAGCGVAAVATAARPPARQLDGAVLDALAAVAGSGEGQDPAPASSPRPLRPSPAAAAASASRPGHRPGGLVAPLHARRELTNRETSCTFAW
jgi:CubicO group peptidase (beta-lactamase class C family)